jgi:hypothetical protein
MGLRNEELFTTKNQRSAFTELKHWKSRRVTREQTWVKLSLFRSEISSAYSVNRSSL